MTSRHLSRWHFITLALILTLAAVLAGTQRRSKPEQTPEEQQAISDQQKHTPNGRLAECQANLRQIASALESNISLAGHRPDSLNELVPTFMTAIPQCPAARLDTYSQGYDPGPMPDPDLSEWPDYNIRCSGHHHGEANLQANLPAFHSLSGMTPALPFLGSAPEGRQLCEVNLKKIGTAVEMYAIDYNGNYPDSLKILLPNYLGAIPACPVGGSDTYSANYQHGTEARDNANSVQAYYSIRCSAPHEGSENPTWDAIRGLHGRP